MTLTMEQIEEAKKLINKYSMEEFQEEMVFSDLENVGLAYTTASPPINEYRDEYDVQASIDLVHGKMKLYICGDLVQTTEYSSFYEMMSELEGLDFYELTSPKTYVWMRYFYQRCDKLERKLWERGSCEERKEDTKKIAAKTATGTGRIQRTLATIASTIRNLFTGLVVTLNQSPNERK